MHLEGDSFDYDVLFNAATNISNTSGLICELGTRLGGSLEAIIDGLTWFGDNNIRHIIFVDPYGNIEYNSDQETFGKLDYTNSVKNEAISNIYKFAQGKNVNLVFMNLEDTEFFSRFADGVPVYNEEKRIINKYSLVFYDGPHDVVSIIKEIDFFLPRSHIGSMYVFDDIESYPHYIVEQYIFKHGFVLFESGRMNRKKSYKKIK